MQHKQLQQPLLPERDDCRILTCNSRRFLSCPLRVRPDVNLNYTPEEQAFREQVRNFVRANLPGDIGQKVLHHKRLSKDDHVRWQKILYQQGWIAPGWPVEYGGTGWTAVRKHTSDA